MELKKALFVLLQFARGQAEFGPDVLEASFVVLKYVYGLVAQKVWGAEGDLVEEAKKLDVVESLEVALAEEEGEAKGLGVAIWVSIGLWVAQKVLERMFK